MLYSLLSHEHSFLAKYYEVTKVVSQHIKNCLTATFGHVSFKHSLVVQEFCLEQNSFSFIRFLRAWASETVMLHSCKCFRGCFYVMEELPTFVKLPERAWIHATLKHTRFLQVFGKRPSSRQILLHNVNAYKLQLGFRLSRSSALEFLDQDRSFVRSCLFFASKLKTLQFK